MKPDSFKSQLQAVLTAFHENIKGVQGASVCPKTKIVKRRFEDQEDAGITPKDDASIKDAGGAAAAPAAVAAAAAPAAASSMPASSFGVVPASSWSLNRRLTILVLGKPLAP